MSPASFLVRIVSGPARGWEYVTFLIPEQVILVAPNPGESNIGGKEVHGAWMRVPRGGAPWPGECRYRRGELPVLGQPVPDELLTTDDDVIVNYELAP